ncbi:MAG: DegT/DnrJ/EryC1/StrS family aminotransferase [Deltaproteobacteria bacterium]|nr:DegT/DnrJ/EryC1/StrS family aminotransferase [Deltaproteobacteria bacterium]
MAPDLKRLVMRHYRRIGPALDLASRVRKDLVVPYEAYDRHNRAVEADLQRELAAVLSAGNTFDLWSYARRFELDFAAWCDRRHGVGTSSCTAALAMTLTALGVGPGDEVVTSAHTFIATALAIRSVGAVPVPVDPRPLDLGLTAEAVEGALTSRTRAVMPVHMHGHPCDIGPILDLGQARGIPVVEDCAQAHGARYRGRRLPAGPVGCFSFWPNKPLGGAGNGGILVTDDEDLARRVETARDPDGGDPIVARAGRTPGFLNSLEAALLKARLPHLDAWLGRRARIAERYRAAFRHLDPVLPGPETESAWYSFVLRPRDRDALKRRLARARVESRVEYAVPWFASPTFADPPPDPARFPVARRAAGHGLSLPVHPMLTDEEVDRVVQAVGDLRS